MNLEKRKEFMPEEISLQHNKTGETKKFILRPFKVGDEEGVIECITSEYGETYFKKDFYNPDKLRHKATGDDYCFFVAESGERILGILVFALFRNEDFLEPCSEIFHKDCRGYGLAEEFVKYTFPLAKSLEPQCLFVHAVTFHNVTQVICERQGMIPVGFRLGSFRLEICENSYDKLGLKKQSEGIMILPIEKKSANKVYVPDELYDFIKTKYDELGVNVEISTANEDDEKEAAKRVDDGIALDDGNTKSIDDFCGDTNACDNIIINTDDRQRMELISVRDISIDFLDDIKKRLKAHTEDLWVYQITLPIDSPSIFDVYEELKKMGFFFTGLRPVCGEKECIYMQYVGELDLQMDKYTLTPEYSKVRNTISYFYDRRIRK